MLYNSVYYLVCFLGLAFIIYSIVPKKNKWIVLLTFSYIFYLINGAKYIVFILLTTGSTYFAGLFLNQITDCSAMAKKGVSPENKKKYKSAIKWQKKAVVAVVVIFNIGLLVFLKYFNFLGSSANSLLSVLHVRPPFHKLHLALPLGISFYTLQAISYIVDVYRGKYKGDKNFGKVALFLVFWPQIVEGPIGRFDLLANQLYEGHDFDIYRISYAGERILWGLIKKVVIADRANTFVGNIFQHYQDYSGATIVIVMLVYTLQIYADFSGSIDIAAGSAELFGVSLSENFRRPFFSKTVNEFWRRWHITLGSWLRDYVFYPVSLSKVFGKLSKWASKHFNSFWARLLPAYFALLFVWLGNGFWHGASWKYVCYGLYYFFITAIGMLCEPMIAKCFDKTHISRKSKPFMGLQILRTFALVNIGMLMFRADSLSAFFSMFRSIFTKWNFDIIKSGTIFQLGCDRHDFFVLGLGTVLLFVVGLLQEKGHRLRKDLENSNIVARWAVIYAMLFVVVIFGAYGMGYKVVDPIYGQF